MQLVDPPLPHVVRDYVARTVVASPTGLAVCAPDGRLTYAELNARADLLADGLRALGAGPGSLVALYLDRSAALVVAALGALKTGAAYVAFDPDSPGRRVDELLLDCGAAVVVTDSDRASRLGGGPGVPLPGVGIVRPLHTEEAQRATLLPPDLAYVNYTSGSTGRPRAVMVGHAGLANLVHWHCRSFSITPADRCTQIANPGFDAFAWEIWPCLAAGAALYIPPNELKSDPASLRDWLVQERITVGFLPTPLAELVVDLDWPATAALRCLLTGGDRLRRSPRPGLPFDLVNNYGVTEATVVSTSGLVPPGPAVGPPSIGSPIDGVSIRVVDAELDEVPVGSSGELLIGGVSVALGYLGADTRAAERFVEDLRGDPAALRWYRTGDIVRQRTDGAVEYIGRADDQVQIRGQRVEPAEVVLALDSHPAVRSSEVVTTEDGAGDRSLVAYVQLVDGQSTDTAALRDHVMERLPSHMVPGEIVWIDEMPVSANGKVDRQELYRRSTRTSQPPSRPPEGYVEATVAVIVAELLGLDEVGPDEDFILLGGHSLLAARLVVRIADRFGVELPLRSVFERATVSGIAAEVLDRLIAEVGALTDEEAVRLVELHDGG